MSLRWLHNGRDGLKSPASRTVYSTVYSGADQRKHQSSASLTFVQGIHRWPVNSPHKGPVTRKMFSFDDVIMCSVKTTEGVQPIKHGHNSVVLYFARVMSILKGLMSCILSIPFKIACFWDSHMIAQVPVKQPCNIGVNTACIKPQQSICHTHNYSDVLDKTHHSTFLLLWLVCYPQC